MDVFTARMQATLTLILVVAFIALLIYDAETADSLKEFVGLAVTFWLLRQRPSDAPLRTPQAINPPPEPPTQSKEVPPNG